MRFELKKKNFWEKLLSFEPMKKNLWKKNYEIWVKKKKCEKNFWDFKSFIIFFNHVSWVNQEKKCYFQKKLWDSGKIKKLLRKTFEFWANEKKSVKKKVWDLS